MAGLGALAQLQLDHFYLWVGGGLGEAFGGEGAVQVAGAEIATADLPDDVAAGRLVMRGIAALAGVMREVAEVGAGVECADGLGRQRAEGHGGDVEHAGAVGVGAVGAADHHPGLRLLRRAGGDGMLQPLEAGLIDLVLGAEGALVQHHLGALVDQAALVAAEGRAVLLILEEVLAHLRADFLQQEAEVGDDGVVAQNRVAGVEQVLQPQQGQQAGQQQQRGQPMRLVGLLDQRHPQGQAGQRHQGQHDEARREWQPQLGHGRSPRGDAPHPSGCHRRM